jgi:TldD protein
MVLNQRTILMTDIAATDDLFFNRTGMDQSRVQGIVDDALGQADDGELFLEYAQSEALVFDDGQLKNASFDIAQGFGLRAVAGESSGYSHASDMSEAALKRAASTVKAVQAGHDGTMAEAPALTNQSLYIDDNPLNLVPFEAKVKLLADIDAYARSKDDRIRQVSASLSGEWQAVQIIRADGSRAADIRPLVRLNVSCVVGDGDRMESGSYGASDKNGEISTTPATPAPGDVLHQ